MPPLPMFPLGSVLVPSALLPLHVFEPRYRALVHDALAGAREFGVCLIERGSEVGGGEDRLGTGTVARIQEAAETPDGRWAIVAVGTRRFVVERWLDDDPYPRAEVRDAPDPAVGEAEVEMLEPVKSSVESALAKMAEIEGIDPPVAAWSDDPSLATFQLAARAPLGPMDRYRLLCAETVGLRLALLADLLAPVHEMLDRRAGGGSGSLPDDGSSR